MNRVPTCGERVQNQGEKRHDWDFYVLILSIIIRINNGVSHLRDAPFCIYRFSKIRRAGIFFWKISFLNTVSYIKERNISFYEKIKIHSYITSDIKIIRYEA